MSCARAMSKAKLFRRWREHDDPVPTLWYGIAFVEYYRADVLCFFLNLVPLKHRKEVAYFFC